MKKSDRIKGLDGLRALAIIGIVLYHALPGYVPGGYLGVNAFFTIMGYLMVYTVRSAFDEDGVVPFVLHYYQKKIVRLYPQLLLLLCLVLSALLLLAPDYAKGMGGEIVSIIFGYNNWWQVFQNASYFARMMNSSPLTHLWYMGLTVQYYLLWPFLFIAGGLLLNSVVKHGDRKKGRTVLLLLLLFLSLLSMVEMSLLYNPAADPSRIYYGTDTRAFALFLGMFVAFLPFRAIANKLGSLQRHLTVPAAVLLGFIIVSYLTVNGESAENYRYLMQLVSIAFALLLLCILLDQKTLGKISDIAPLRVIGDVSYEIYLVMYPVIWFVQRLMPSLSTPLYSVLCLLLIALLAAALHAIPAAWKAFSKEKVKSGFMKRTVPALLLVLCVGLTAQQTRMAGALGTEEGMEALKEQLAESEAVLSENNTAQLSAALVSQLSMVDVNVNLQADAVKAAAEERAQLSEGDAEARALIEERLARGSVSAAQAVPAVVSGTAIGDSVMLGASGALQEAIGGLYVDAAQSRQINAGPQIIESLAGQGLLGPVVVIHLGTNGVRKLSEYQAIVDTIGPEHKIFWVNTRGEGWYAEVNANIDTVVAANINVTLIDWYNYADGHPEWFAPDGIHLNSTGAAAYAALIKEATGL